jgi:hypothetical protein
MDEMRPDAGSVIQEVSGQLSLASNTLRKSGLYSVDNANA